MSVPSSCSVFALQDQPQSEYAISFHTFLYSVKKQLVEDIKVVVYLSDVMHC